MHARYLCLALVLAPFWGFAQEIGYVERFALSEDRAQALKELIPGTEPYYYYHCLHYQGIGDKANYGKMLKLWIDRRGHTNGVKELQNRQALLDFEDNPKGAFDRVRGELNLQFNHRRVIPGQKSEAPTAFDNKQISAEALTAQAFKRYRNVEGITQEGLEHLNGSLLNPERRRHFLSRLQRPDVPGLVQLIVADMTWKNKTVSFGAHKIHNLLLKEQLEALARKHAEVLNSSQYANVYMARLAPSPDINRVVDAKAREAHLDRLWNFVADLNPVHNSLKAHVLYSRLVHDREQGVYDKNRFFEYIKLPRNMHYMEPKYLQRPEHRNRQCNLGQSFPSTALPVIGSDEALVRDYLAHFLSDAPDYTAFSSFIKDDFLKRVFATTKILAGKGNPEQWASLLTPTEFQELKDRVDLEFLPTNTRYYGPNEQVAVALKVKNVKNLTVKVFEINTFNYFRVKGAEIDQSIDLDGLVAASEEQVVYEEAPARSVLRNFKFPQIKGRGAWVIEFTGNGKSSRAVVQRGRLQVMQRTTVAGQAFRVLDEQNKPVKGATIWLGGREFTVDKHGEIHIPFSTSPGRVQLLIKSGTFCSRVEIDHQGEGYQLGGGIYVDRESLIKYEKARVVIRPVLTVSGEPASLSLLEDTRLSIHSVDREGIQATKDVQDLKVFDNQELAYEFTVPDKLVTLAFTFSAKVKNVSRDEKQSLSMSETFSLNGIDTGSNTFDLLVTHVGGNYVVDARGKNGEPRIGLPVNVSFQHRWFKQAVNATLQTDGQGRCVLGALENIASYSVTAPNVITRQGQLLNDRAELPGMVQGAVGDTLRLPWILGDLNPLQAVSLIDSQHIADWRKAVSVKDGFLEIAGLPGGDYDLHLKPSGTHIRIRVTGGRKQFDYAMSGYRSLEIRNAAPPHIASVTRQGDQVKIQVANPGEFTRLHVFASRYLPEYSLFGKLGRSGQPGPAGWLRTTPETRYVSGRTLSDEHRYILERKLSEKFPGSMLARPGLLLNPWSLGKTEAAEELLGEGTAFGGGAGGSDSEMRRYGGKADKEGRLQGHGYSNLDFLNPGKVALNLAPDENGVVLVDAKALVGRPLLRVIAVDPRGAVMRHHVLPEGAFEPRELRLAKPMNAKQAFTEQRLVSVLGKGDQIAVDDLSSAKIESYTTLGDAYRLFQTLSGNATLNEFSFILDWPSMDEEQKQERYTKYACHELNVFLYHKDRKWFDRVIAPYLKNKMDKTFVDQWLLDEELVGYLKPWKFNRLNVPERILLGQRYVKAGIPRHVKDRFDLIPPDLDRYSRLFETAAKGSALDSDRTVAGATVTAGNARDENISGALDAFDRDEAGEGLEKQMKRLHEAGNMKQLGAVKAQLRSAKKRKSEAKANEALDDLMDLEAGGVVAGKALNGGFISGRGGEMAARKSSRAWFRKMEATEEWAENNYYQLPIQQQLAGLIQVNAFWNDYAARDPQQPFVSKNLMYAAGNFPGMMLALSVLDLPFTAAEHQTTQDQAKLSIEAAGPMILFHKEIKEGGLARGAAPILVSQNFFRADDRYRHENNERFDKYVREEFLPHVVYGCKIILTNPNSNRQKLGALLQIPAGAIPVNRGFYTRGIHLTLEPFATQTVEYFFYFPRTGNYPHYPVHVARNEKLVAKADAVSLKVVEKLSKIDTASWDYVSQNAEPAEVLRFLDDHNIDRLDLNKIAWRMQDKAFFEKVLLKLDARRVYHNTLWSYGIRHQDPDAAREFIKHSGFADRCGLRIDSPLLTVDPVERFYYQHLEYSPLVNARAHKVGKEQTILNNRLRGQYQSLMNVLKYVKELGDAEQLPVAYYLLLQDRVEEGLAMFDRVDPEQLPTRLQYDYMKVYTAFYRDQLDEAQSIAAQYAKHPVPRWRNKFVNALNQIKEIREGAAVQVVDDESRSQKQDALAATAPAVSFKVEGANIHFDYANLKGCTVNFYPMDIELLFSRNPFIQDQSERFSFIRPDLVRTVTFPADQKTFSYELPAKYRNSNVMIEVLGPGIRKSQAYYANNMAVQLTRNYGQLKVSTSADLKPLSKVYVKVYQRLANGQVKFYKDGYTDFRGRFDYVSLNTPDLNSAQRLALLVMSEEHGAMIQETAPPQR